MQVTKSVDTCSHCQRLFNSLQLVYQTYCVYPDDVGFVADFYDTLQECRQHYQDVHLERCRQNGVTNENDD